MSDQPFLDIQQVSEQLGVSVRTIRNWAIEYEWFGKPLGNTGTWVFTQGDIDKMRVFPRQSAGRPRKPIGSSTA